MFCIYKKTLCKTLKLSKFAKNHHFSKKNIKFHSTLPKIAFPRLEHLHQGRLPVESCD